MKKATFTLLMLTIAFGIAFATGASEEPEASEEDITLRMVRFAWTDFRPPVDEIWMWQEYEEQTGITIEWEELIRSSAMEQKAIILASNELPDAFYQLQFSNEEIANYGRQGVFVSLNDLIDDHGPNLRSIMNEDPAVRQAMTMPDGSIYSLPYLQPDPVETSLRYYVNQEWLDRLGLEVPDTVDELTAVLMAFKEQDANGNGDPDDEFPIAYSRDSYMDLERQLMGSYGLGTVGGQSIFQWIDKGPDGNVRFIPLDPRYKEIWQLFKEWWDADLFHPETFTEVDYAQWVTLLEDDRVGLFSAPGPNAVANMEPRWTGISALEGPYGDQIMSWIQPQVRGIWSFMITSENDYPEETMEWVDYWYGDEGSRFGWLGEEGVTYTMGEDGNPDLIPEIMDYPQGVQVGQFQWVEMVLGGFWPYREMDASVKLSVTDRTVESHFRIDPNDHEQYAPEEIWPPFNPTAEETETVLALLPDIETYLEEMRVQFIFGNRSFDQDWEEFTSTLRDQLNADEYIEVRQQQYERFQELD